MKTTIVFDRILKSHNARTQILQGGTSSSKTYSILQYFYILATQSSKPLLFSVVSESMPHLRRGALRDYMAIIGEDYNPDTHNKTEEIFQIGKSVIEFFAVDNPGKARGGRRDFLFINECNRIPKDTRDQLEVRTKIKEFLDFNPTSAFWAHDLCSNEGVTFDVSTYLDNPYLDKNIIKSIESRRLTNPNWWKVYGLGQIGSREGLIIPEFQLVDFMPDIHTEIGIDFGFVNDSAVVLEAGVHGESLYVNELVFGLGLTNQDLAEKMKEKKIPYDYPGYADSAEPKSITELSRFGFRMIRPCFKGEDSFRIGIDYILRYKVKVTKKSVNIIKDFRNACWQTDIDGKATNKAAHGYLNSIDALRYALTGYIRPGRSAGGNI